MPDDRLERHKMPLTTAVILSVSGAGAAFASIMADFISGHGMSMPNALTSGTVGLVGGVAACFIINVNGVNESPETPPPAKAELLLYYLLPPKNRNDILGDLEEDYWTEFLPKFGPREARRLYWWYAIRSVAPVLHRAVMRGSAVVAILGAAEWLWRKLGT